jgi:hypothetical protein
LRAPVGAPSPVEIRKADVSAFLLKLKRGENPSLIVNCKL